MKKLWIPRMFAMFVFWSLAVACANIARADTGEFTAFRARKVTMFLIVKFVGGAQNYAHVTLPQLVAARERLRTFVRDNDILMQAYSWTVVSHTFDDSEWQIEFNAAFDTDVTAPIPSVTQLMHAYSQVEWFFNNDPVFGSSCWYTGFNQGDHGD